MWYKLARSIEATGLNPAIAMYGLNHNIRIDSNHISGPVSYTTTNYESAIYESASSNDRIWDLRIESNQIKRGAYAISLSGSNQYYNESDIRITNNEILDFSAGGLYLQYIDSILIEANSMTAAFDASSPYGVYMSYLKRVDFLRNKIALKELGGTGLFVSRTSGVSAAPLAFYNNFIQAGGNATALNLNYSSDINFYFNSLNITADSLGNSGTVLRAFISSGLDIKNNNLVNSSGGRIFAGTSYPFSSDFNNIYTTGSEVASQISNLAAWVSATSMDGNSVSADPVYLSNSDLHANQTLLDSAALAYAFITTDIDGDVRNFNFPDIGADEFSLIENVGVLAVLNPAKQTGRRYTSAAFDTSQTIQVVIKNFGPTVSSVPVFYEFNGQTGTDTLKGNFAQASLDTLTFSSRINMDTLGRHQLKVYSALASDQFTANDTLLLDIVLHDNKAVELPLFEDFQNSVDTFLTASAMGIKGMERFDFETSRGRLQTQSSYNFPGARAITLDRPRFGRDESNYLIYTVNLSNYDLQDSVYLDFDYRDHGEERDNDDRVWIRGNDTLPWINIYDLWGNRSRNRTKSVRRLAMTTELAKAGQTFSSSFQIRFGEEDNEPLPRDGFTFDNILLDIVHPVDLILSEATSDYFKIPAEHNWTTFSARLRNKGYLKADSTRFKYQINQFSDSLMLDSLAAKSEINVKLAGDLNATANSFERVHFSALTSDVDGDRRNDSSSVVIELTDTILARDNGSVDSTFGFTGIAGEMAQLFEINKSDTLTGISFFLNFPALGDSVRVKLRENNNGVPGAEIASSNPFGFSSNAGRWYDLQFNCLQMVDSGSFFVAVEQMGNKDLTLGFSYFNYRPNVAHYKTAGGNWQTLTSIGLEAIFNIRPIFGHYKLPSLSVQNSICEDAMPVRFSASPSGGLFVGPGIVNDSLFDPSITGTGIYQIKYYVSRPNGCIDTNGFEISVDSITPVIFTDPADVCSNETSLTLNTANPAGGVYSGLGVNANQFNPSAVGVGSFQLYYEFSNLNSCVSRDTAEIEVLQAPSAALSTLPSFCEGDTAQVLNQGSPAGGQYIGTGVQAGVFNPVGLSSGSYNIAYAVIDPNNCTDTAFGDIIIDTIPNVDLGPDIEICGNQTDTLVVLNFPASYDWSTGESTQSIVVSSSNTISVLVTDNNSCVGTDTVIVNYEAICVSVDEVLSNAKINYYPNPSNGQFSLKVEGIDGEVSLSIRDLRGRIIESHTWKHSSENWIEAIDIREQSAGVYMLELQSSKGKSIHRVTLR